MLDSIYDFIMFNFVEVLEFDFYRQAIYASILISIATALVSLVLVHKNWAMLGMGLSNSVLPGVVIGSKFAWPLAMTVGAFSSSLLCFYLTYIVLTYTRLKEDAAMGLCYTSFFAIGLLILNFIETETHVLHILFGNLLGMHDHEYYELIFTCLVVIVFFVVKFRDIVLFTFDELQFKVLGLNFKLFHHLILVLLTLTIIASLQAIGILLTISYLVLPTVTAQQLTNKLHRTLMIGIVSNLVASYFGISVAFILDVATGPTIVVLQSFIFALAYCYNKISHSRQRRIQLQQVVNN